MNDKQNVFDTIMCYDDDDRLYAKNKPFQMIHDECVYGMGEDETQHLNI